MAPTLRSPYRILKCPNCGGQLLVPLPDPRYSSFPDQTQHGICADCLRSAEIPTSQLTGPVLPADHFVATKFLTANRWDLATFRRPDGQIYVKRLAALPGESVAIDSGGHLSINGAPISPPPDLPKLTFPWPDPRFQRIDWSLLPNKPIHLGPDDYFFLGDNSTDSEDSRAFGPLHKSDILGVATVIYWPPNRIKILR